MKKLTKKEKNPPGVRLLGRWIKDARQAQRMTQAEMTMLLDKPVVWGSRVEMTRIIPTDEELQAICKLLHVDFEEAKLYRDTPFGK